MPNTLSQRFIDALAALESSRDPQPLVSLFTADAEIGNVVAPEKFHGTDGVRDFWTKYRDTFQTLRSTFRNQIEHGDRIALEWNTQGTSAQGAPIEYDGVSMLEVADGKISRFRAYFDPAALGRQLETVEAKTTQGS